MEPEFGVGILVGTLTPLRVEFFGQLTSANESNLYHSGIENVCLMICQIKGVKLSDVQSHHMVSQ